MSMGLRKGPILPIAQTNGRYKSPVKIREVQLSSARSDDCRGGLGPPNEQHVAIGCKPAAVVVRRGKVLGVVHQADVQIGGVHSRRKLSTYGFK
jgi:hypothetical protein